MTADSTPERLLTDAAWLRRLTRRLVGEDAAPDLAQDIAVAALSGTQMSLGRSWLATVGRNLAVSSLRKKSTERKHRGKLETPEPPPSPAELAENAELQQRAVAAVLALPNIYRDTVLMRVMQGMPIAAVAYTMNVPEETVRTRQRRALARVRRTLGLRPEPNETHTPHRGIAAIVLPWLSWSATVKAKHWIVAMTGVLLLGAASAVIPWNAKDRAQPQPQAPAPATANAPTTEAPQADSIPRELAANPFETESSADLEPVVDTSSLAVEVRWENQTPAVGIPVHIYQRRSTGITVATNEEGRVAVTGLAPARYIVRLPDYESEVVFLETNQSKDLVLELKDWVFVSGSVITADGGLVPFAELQLSHAGIAPQWSSAIGRCDSHGKFRIRTRLGVTLLRAEHKGLGISDSLMLDKDHFGGSEPDEVVLRLSNAVCSVRGKVVDQSGVAVAGAWVQLGKAAGPITKDPQGLYWGAVPPTVRSTDKAGGFSMDAVRVDTKELFIYRAGFAAHSQTLELLPHGIQELRVVLHPGAQLFGSVRDAAGNPIAGAELGVANLPAVQEDTANTDADGTFRLKDLPPGKLTVGVFAPGYGQEQRQLVVGVDQPTEVNFTLKQGPHIRGLLTDPDHQPLAGWSVTVPGVNRFGVTDEEGRFVIADCEVLDNALLVRESPGYSAEVIRFEGIRFTNELQHFIVPDNRRATSRFRGRVADRNNEPIAGIEIVIRQRDRRVFVRHSITRTKADGTFECGPLPPDVYEIEPTHSNWTFAAFEVDLSPNATFDVGTQQGTRK